MEFYRSAFGAEETARHADGNGKIRHGEFRIGNSIVMIHDEFPEFPDMHSVQSLGGTPVNMFLYVDDADKWFERATAAGAGVVAAMSDKEYGRTGGVKDPFG